MKLCPACIALIAGTVALGIARAQPEKPAKPEVPAAKQPAAKIVGDPYPLGVCPISGKKLGEMGEPVVKVYDGREVRFCCDMCVDPFEQDLKASAAKLDARIMEDQKGLYPLETSVVSGKALPEKPVEFVWGNRLVRVASEGEKAAFLRAPEKLMAALNTAVIAAQGKGYPLKTCPVSGDALDSMGKPKEVVVGGRLIRLCCSACKKELATNPARFIAMVDEARKGAKK
jgi:hypothetical protein